MVERVEADILGGLLSGARGPLGGYGRERLRANRQNQLQDVYGRAGLLEQSNIKDENGQILLGGGGLGEHLLANGMNEGLPFVSQAASINQQNANREDMQAHQWAMYNQSEQDKLAANQRLVQQQQYAAYNNPLDTDEQKFLETQIADVQLNNARYTTLQSINDRVSTGALDSMGAKTKGRLAQDVHQALLAEMKSRGEAGTPAEYATAMQALLGTDSINDWFDLIGRKKDRALGGLQQAMAATALKTKQGEQALGWTAKNKHATARAQQVAGQIHPNIRNANIAGMLQTAQQKAFDKIPGGGKKSGKTRSDYEDAVTRQGQTPGNGIAPHFRN